MNNFKTKKKREANREVNETHKMNQSFNLEFDIDILLLQKIIKSALLVSIFAANLSRREHKKRKKWQNVADDEHEKNMTNTIFKWGIDCAVGCVSRGLLPSAWISSQTSE